ncbi:MAG: hypothetical protein A2725_02890 [Candidatus Magasanikbacteria bacterium RIFCSPHIGHO2_01_FULL_33_34]|uniref:Fibronectin type-III domain-containing protein n=1 Tax=Candidatus Magasanikbacteria bacterium RIFCSPHIGHO2_01_FULL_33_34 TaxID=1798671 RepID=A0A1F6LGR2_9BACT|nr:MAG: hypothetical protein A2725_02890 [Candidatus Magasanikbacteria bacterium RIFCSPHIGHO2_01_FULL_33_34]OGH66079.1 MAG: hypothetical protein A3B83_00380 [Candidatus Magasanikbacteria bacterium RIFCSPHIGHO2_02_FULL_33_17]OGH75925.1 MAG: hypothetical protein A3A89_00290 [Candidatus Magasanikbacteria bacterium RIFCSPLOWO2_01_FULL_33_34]
MKKINLFALFALAIGMVFAVPVHAQESDCPTLVAGDIFKVTGHSAVYLLDDNLKRLYFPHADVFKSWYDDYSSVVEIPETCVDAYPAPLDPPFGVNYRPGSRLVKVKISPSVYVIEPGNRLRKIGSEQVARELYGPNWAKLVRDVSDAFWPNFKNRGQEIKDSRPHDGMFLQTPRMEGIFYVENGVLKKLEDTSEVDEDDVRVVNWGVFAKLHLRSGAVKATRAFLKPHQKHRDGGSDDEVVNEEDEDELEVLDENEVDNSKVRVCHIPPGNISNKHTISVSRSALNAHLSHGDNEGECKSDDNGTTTDTTAPVISGLNVTVTSTSATITWSTDESATSELNYNTPTSTVVTSTYEFSVDAVTVENNNGTFTHTVELSGLVSGTYYFQVESKDPADNKTKKEGNFTI